MVAEPTSADPAGVDHGSVDGNEAPDPELARLGADTPLPDPVATAEAARRLHPRRQELGRLGELAEWLAGVRPSGGGLDRVSLIRVGTEGTPDPSGAGVSVRSVELTGVEPDPGGIATAVAAGVDAADLAVDSGAELVLASGGHCAPTQLAALSLVAICTDTEPAKVLPRGDAATRPEEWMELAVAVRDRRRQATPDRGDPGRLLSTLGAPELAALTGLVLRATARRTAVVLDGLAATAAALLAYEITPAAAGWLLAADRSPAPAVELAQLRLGLHPVLDLGLDLSDGSAALLVVPILHRALALLADEPAIE